MPRIDLDLNTDLMVTDDGYLTLRISPDEDNSLSLTSDGLMSVGSVSVSGWNAKSGQILEGLTIGQVSVYNKNLSNPSGRIATTGIVHRIFTSHGEKPGEELTGRFTKDYFRSDMDYCLPGDIFRVRIDNDDHYDYYLILKVDPRKEGDKYEPGNMIARYVKLGTFGDLSEPEDEWTPLPEPDKADTIEDKPTTIGGSDVIAYEDLEHVNIGDRVVVKSNADNWLSDSEYTSREISSWEHECVWHVKEKIQSQADISKIRKRSAFSPTILEHHSKYAINVSGPSDILQYRVFVYLDTSGGAIFAPDKSILDWTSAITSTIIDLDVDVTVRVVLRHRDNSPINNDINSYKVWYDVWNPLTQAYDPYVTADELTPLQDGELNTSTGEEVNGGLDGSSTDAISVHSHYEPLRYKPNTWNITYSTYYEYIPSHFEKIPDSVVDPPSFDSNIYYKQQKGYGVVTDQPLNWLAPNVYKNYYERVYQREKIISHALTNVNFEQGAIDDITGEPIASSTRIRSTFNSIIPSGKYAFYTQMLMNQHPVQLNLYVYNASTGEYISSESIKSWPYADISNHILSQDSRIVIVIRRDDEQDIVPSDVSADVNIVKYPTVDPDKYSISEENGYYVWYDYRQLTQTTPFISGQFYKITDIYVRVLIKPEDWDVSFLNYYTKCVGRFEQVHESSIVPEFVVGKYYELVFDDPNASDTLVFEEDDRIIYLRSTYKAPAFSASDLENNTLVRLSNAPYWDKGTPLWSKTISEVTRDISSRINPPEMTYSIGSIDAFTGRDLDDITFANRIRTKDSVVLAEDALHSTSDEIFVLNASGVTHCVMYVYFKAGNTLQYQHDLSISDWRELPFRFRGFDNAFASVRFVFKNDEGSISPSSIQNITLTTEKRTVMEAEPCTDEELFSIWYIKDETVAPDATTVTIARKRSASGEELVRENVPIKCLDPYMEVASVIELHVGEMVSISDNAETWADGDLITEDERKLYTYMVIRRDLSTKLFTLNNGKSLQREYLIKLSRITFTTSDNDMGTDTPDDPVPDDPNPDNPDGGDG
jgi:hypothetical protein